MTSGQQAFSTTSPKSLIGAARKILSDFHGKVPQTMDELLTVPGAARKTANVVLGTAYGIGAGLVVDTHVQRIRRRPDLTRNDEPIKIEKDLMEDCPGAEMDFVLAPGHLLWPANLRGA